MRGLASQRVAGRGVGEKRLRLEEVSLEDLPRYPYRRARAIVLPDLAVEVSEKDNF